MRAWRFRVLAVAGGLLVPAAAMADSRPNVVLIMTDDQGYGDLGCTGNDKIRTPNLDRLAESGAWFERFHVSPVCTPTRASLMTGRYNFRTRAIDTYIGRAMMDPDEWTLAEAMAAGGYATGIFGKWHLGDNYPMRPIDQGFQESLVHKGGGLAQPSGPPDEGYFDPTLWHNGKAVATKGYCTDIFTNAAIGFVERNRSRPFFVYLATNAPHDPLQIADEYVRPYRAMGLDEKTAKVYGMVANIDENVGRLLAKLRDLGLERDTIVVFLTDNGPAGKRYNAGMRGTKGTVYEGGIRVPCFVRWPARIRPGTRVQPIAAHIDLMPTLLDACGTAAPKGLRLDGVSLLPLLLEQKVDWPQRRLFFQWHRGDEPVAFRNCAVLTERWKMVDGKELYDLIVDPAEQNDVAAQHPDVAERLRADYEAWLKDVSATRGYAPPRIVVGTEHENPVTLTRQDWRSPTGWADEHCGHWEIRIAEAGVFDVTAEFPKNTEGETVRLRIGADEWKTSLSREKKCGFDGLQLKAGDTEIEVWIVADGTRRGAAYVHVMRVK